MSPFLRGTLFGAAIVFAFVAGYLTNRRPAQSTEVSHSIVVSTATPPAEKPLAIGPTPAELPTFPGSQADVPPSPEPEVIVAGLPVSHPQLPTEPTTPKIDFDNLPPPNLNDPVPPNDLAMQIIRKQLGIKTTIVDKHDPLPPVLSDAKKDLEPTLPHTDIGPMPMMAPKFDSPPPPRPCSLVNTRDVAVDFETTRMGSTRIAAVELWTTRDGGQTWSCTDRMTTVKSPFRTRLGSEGVYGFRIVFENELGLRSVEPKVSDSPDMLVELDLQSPRVSTVKVDAIVGQPGALKLSWTIADKHDDPSSTRLEYSTDACDWQSIDLTKLRREGDRYEVDWALPTSAPSQVFFRLTARDLAGNQTVSESQNKMTIDLVVPEGKVTGVRSERTEPEIGPMPRLVVEGLSSKIIMSVVDEFLSNPVFQYSFPINNGNSNGSTNAESLFDKLTSVEFNVPAHRIRDAFEPPLAFPERVPESLEHWDFICGTDNEKEIRKLQVSRLPPYVMQRGFVDHGQALTFRPIEQSSPYLARQKLLRGTSAYSGGRSIPALLAETDWKPSTAKPESYCLWSTELTTRSGDFHRALNSFSDADDCLASVPTARKNLHGLAKPFRPCRWHGR